MVFFLKWVVCFAQSCKHMGLGLTLHVDQRGVTFSTIAKKKGAKQKNALLQELTEPCL